MATDYPIEITDPDGSVRIAGLADFTDPSNAPASAASALPPGWSADGSDLDAGGNSLEGVATVTAQALHGAALSVTGNVSADATTLGFFGVTAVTQQPTPVLLTDVIALLQAYGLSA